VTAWGALVRENEVIHREWEEKRSSRKPSGASPFKKMATSFPVLPQNSETQLKSMTSLHDTTPSENLVLCRAKDS
jgi:hypothetical protein